ncbi:MAG: hypothetical protein J0L82_10480 [Deltaproteobacteria bacterium]|jgi:hypothetical protein|nr:hypothetical protein [Deltaproteobacteria bacterium]
MAANFVRVLFSFGSLIAGLAIAPPANAQDEKFLSALELAIEHFNADAKSELKSWGPQHTFMYKALSAVEAAYPNLTGVGKLSVTQGEAKFRTLSFQTYDLATDANQVEALKAQVTEISNGCGYSRKTLLEEQNLGYAKPSQSTSVEVVYQLDSRGTMKCVSPTAKVLADLGLNRLVVKERSGGYSSNFEVSLEVSVNTWQDMRYVKNQVLMIPGIDHGFIKALSPPANSMVIGASSDIALVGSTGKASFNDKFTLVYYQGSGDCPAGCINKVYTTVEVTPKPGTDPMQPEFTVTIP